MCCRLKNLLAQIDDFVFARKKNNMKLNNASKYKAPDSVLLT